MKAEKRVDNEMTRLFGEDVGGWPYGVANTFYKAIREAEQEATERAAKIAEAHVVCDWSKLPGKAVDDYYGKKIAAAIRERGGCDGK